MFYHEDNTIHSFTFCSYCVCVFLIPIFLGAAVIFNIILTLLKSFDNQDAI